MKKLEQIKKYTEQATPGPWETEGMDAGHSQYEMNIWIETKDGEQICDMEGLSRSRNETYNDSGSADAWFIANARTDVPKLVEALEGVLEYVADCKETGYTVDGDYLAWVIEKALAD